MYWKLEINYTFFSSIKVVFETICCFNYIFDYLFYEQEHENARKKLSNVDLAGGDIFKQGYQIICTKSMNKFAR